jgi:hypothetical protein
MTRGPLARFAMSFFIIGLFLAWEGYQGALGKLGPIGNGKIILYLVGSMCCFVMGVLGVRQQHRK